MPAGELRAGDGLVGHDGQAASVEAVEDAGEWARVYNLRVAEYHTYFVGSAEWGFSLWAHNEYSGTDVDAATKRLIRDGVNPVDAHLLARKGDLPGINGDTWLNDFSKSVKRISDKNRQLRVNMELVRSPGDMAFRHPTLHGEFGAGFEGALVLGGRHRQTEVGGLLHGTESHHLIAHEVSPIQRQDAPAIRMATPDHRASSGTWGGSLESIQARGMQSRLIARKDLTGAYAIGIDMVRQGTHLGNETGIAQATASLPKNSDGSINWSQMNFRDGQSNQGWR